MKRPIFYIAILFILSSLLTSCTTDSYDKDMNQSVSTPNTITEDITDPIIIPKKD